MLLLACPGRLHFGDEPVFRTYLLRELKQWSEKGLLAPGQADVLLADHDSRHTGFSLSSVLAVLAALLFGAAVVALVAANWEVIPRLLRVALIMVLIVAGLLVAFVSRKRGAIWISEAALVFVLLCFGAGIALVAQMYHLSGEEADAYLLWTAGALVVSLSFSSGMAAIWAALMGMVYFFYEYGVFGSSYDLISLARALTVLFVALACAVAAWRSGSRVAAHLTAIMLIVWVVWLVDGFEIADPAYVLAFAGMLAFLAGSFPPPPLSDLITRHGSVSLYGCLLAFAGLAIIQFDLSGRSLATEMALAGLILAISVAVIGVAGRANRAIRRMAYFVFAAETIYVVGETLGSLIGSSGFLFFGGLVLAVLAYAVMKIERRFRAQEAKS